MKRLSILLAVCFYSLNGFAETRTYSECIIEDASADSYYLGNIKATLTIENSTTGKKFTLEVFEDYDSSPELTWKTRTFKKRHMSGSRYNLSGKHRIVQKFIGLDIGGVNESFVLTSESITLFKYVNPDYKKSITCYK